jgi:hypothetical protein
MEKVLEAIDGQHQRATVKPVQESLEAGGKGRG